MPCPSPQWLPLTFSPGGAVHGEPPTEGGGAKPNGRGLSPVSLCLCLLLLLGLSGYISGTHSCSNSVREAEYLLCVPPTTPPAGLIPPLPPSSPLRLNKNPHGCCALKGLKASGLLAERTA